MIRVDGARGAGRALAVHGLPPRRAAVTGGAAVVVTALALALVPGHLSPAAEALLLVAPVVATAALGGRRPAWFATALATLLFLLLLPPFGSLRLRFSEDVVALAVFTVVALVAGGVVAVRIEVLGRIERQRAALLRSVSHDLRSPLAVIAAGVSELQDESVHSPQTRRRLLALVEDEAEHLDQMVANLLSLARLEGGDTALRLEPVDLGELVASCVDRILRRDSGVDITVDVQGEVPFLDADRTLLEQLVTNLLENAVRHSPPGAPVAVSVTGRDRRVELAVDDGGPGTRPENVPGIFEPFRSGPMSGTSGLGLAICQAVARAHGGTIEVRDSSRGGATFRVALPVR